MMRVVRLGLPSVEPLELRRLLSVEMVIDAAGLSSSNSVMVDGTAYFFADNGEVGRELWKSDGTVAGTTLVKDLTPGPGGNELHSIFPGADGGAIFLTVVRHPVSPGVREYGDYTLWATDGTGDGTVKLSE